MALAFGSDDEWDALIYGQSHPSTVNFLQNQFNNFGSVLNDAGKAFMEKGRIAFEHFNGANAIRFAREAVRTVQGIFETPRIRELSTLKDMTGCNDIMQRWVMANPTVRQKYFDQRIDGYSDTFTNIHGSDIGENHYDLRRVMDGIAVFDANWDWKITEYVEDLLEGDRDLIFEEQMDIQRTWSAMDIVMAIGKDDPTSSTGGKM